MHNCPRCGKKTTGAWSEGGLKWAICNDCMIAQGANADKVSNICTPCRDGRHYACAAKSLGPHLYVCDCLTCASIKKDAEDDLEEEEAEEE